LPGRKTPSCCDSRGPFCSPDFSVRNRQGRSGRLGSFVLTSQTPLFNKLAESSTGIMARLLFFATLLLKLVYRQLCRRFTSPQHPAQSKSDRAASHPFIFVWLRTLRRRFAFIPAYFPPPQTVSRSKADKYLVAFTTTGSALSLFPRSGGPARYSRCFPFRPATPLSLLSARRDFLPLGFLPHSVLFSPVTSSVTSPAQRRELLSPPGYFSEEKLFPGLFAFHLFFLRWTPPVS